MDLRDIHNRVTTFARRNLNFSSSTPTPPPLPPPSTITVASDDDDEARPFPRSIFHSSIERTLRRFSPIALYIVIMEILFFSAVLLTAILGDGTFVAPPEVATATKNSTGSPLSHVTASIAMGTNSSSSSSSRAKQQTEVAVPHNNSLDDRIAGFVLFFSMSLFSIFTTLLAFRLMQRARLASALTAMRERRGQTNPSMNRWINLQLGQFNPDLRSRMRLAFMNRDFDGNDYELLNQLDEQNEARTAATEAEINRLPLQSITQGFIDSAMEESNSAHPSNTSSAPSSSSSSSAAASSSSQSSSYSSRLTCSICLAPYEAGDVVRTVLCMHQFHKDCIDSWLRNKNECPVCKCPATG